MTDRSLRFWIAVDDYAEVIAVALLLVAALGGYLAYDAYETTDTQVEPRTVATWQSTGEFDHRATIINGTAAFAEGTVLRDRSVYFRRVTPRLNGSFTYGYMATGGGDLQTNASLALVLRSAQTTDEGNETVYWRIEQPLGNATAESLSPEESINVPFSVNASAAALRAETIDEQLGGTPGQTEIAIRARVTLSGTRNGKPVDRTRLYRLPISVERGVYRVQDRGGITNSGSQTEQVRVEVPPGPLKRFGGPTLALVGIVGVTVLAIGRYTGWIAVSDAERSWVTYRNQRAEYDDWITTAKFPAGVLNDRPVVEVDSLEGLVDFAIDTGERVVEEGGRHRYAVLGNQYAYIYTPPLEPRGIESDLNESGPSRSSHGDTPEPEPTTDADLDDEDVGAEPDSPNGSDSADTGMGEN